MPKPLQLSISDEDPGSTPFDELVARYYAPSPPQDVRDRIELPALCPEVVHAAVDRAVRGFTRRPGRHNRYVPVPGEHSLRTDDLVDFLFCYGHEYRLTIFRAADVRTGSLLDPAAVHGESIRQGSACAWDWTGATDWLSADEIPTDAAFVFWSTHTSLRDDVEIPAGYWIPGEDAMPAHLQALTPFPPAQISRMRARSAEFVAALEGAARIHHPGGLAPGLPIVVIDGVASTESAAAVSDAVGILAVARHAEDLVIVPRADADPEIVMAHAKALALALRKES